MSKFDRAYLDLLYILLFLYLVILLISFGCMMLSDNTKIYRIGTRIFFCYTGFFILYTFSYLAWYIYQNFLAPSVTDLYNILSIFIPPT